MNIFKRLLASLEARLSQPRLSIWRTLYFNFRTLPFSTAIKLPVFIYGPVRLFILIGKVKFENTEIRRGMVKIGVNGDSFSLFDHSGYIQLASSNSLLIFEGPCRIALNSKIRVCGGTLRLGRFTRIGSNAKVICNGGNITIKEFTGVTFECVVMNSSFHYTYNEKLGAYQNRTIDITIGAYNWIGNRSTIYAGAITPDFAVIGSCSFVNKDFSKLESENKGVLLAGTPAKYITSGIRRVFSPDCENKVYDLFRNNPSAKYVKSEEFEDNPEHLIIEM